MNTQARWMIWVMMLQATLVYPLITLFLEPIGGSASLGLVLVGGAAVVAAVGAGLAQLRPAALSPPARLVLPLALGEGAAVLSWAAWWFGAPPVIAYGGMLLGTLAVLFCFPRADAET